jgi:hypothetical protein
MSIWAYPTWSRTSMPMPVSWTWSHMSLLVKQRPRHQRVIEYSSLPPSYNNNIWRNIKSLVQGQLFLSYVCNNGVDQVTNWCSRRAVYCRLHADGENTKLRKSKKTSWLQKNLLRHSDEKSLWDYRFKGKYKINLLNKSRTCWPLNRRKTWR